MRTWRKEVAKTNGLHTLLGQLLVWNPPQHHTSRYSNVINVVTAHFDAWTPKVRWPLEGGGRHIAGTDFVPFAFFLPRGYF